MINIITLNVYVQPNAKQFEVNGMHDGCYKIKIPAPATDDKANEYLCKAIAKIFQVPQKAVVLHKGQKSRYKTLRIHEPKQIPDWYDAQK